jgi:hypothetical protein
MARLDSDKSLARRSDCCRSCWQRAQLSHERHVIANAPTLYRLAVAETQHVDVIHSNLAIRGRDAHQVAGMPTVQGAVDSALKRELLEQEA